jgi:hypothetical protein
MKNNKLLLHLPLVTCHSLLVTYFLFAGCGEELMQADVNTATPIVESYLEEGKNSLTVKLYSMEIYLGEDYVLSQPVGGLSLRVNDRALTETAAGAYSLDLGSDTIRGGQEYRLRFEYRGKTVNASTVVPSPVSNLTVDPAYIYRSSSSGFWDMEEDSIPITLSWDNPDNGYYQVYVDAGSASDDYFAGDSFRRRMMQPVQASSYRLNRMDLRSIGNYSIYVYRVNKEYVELYERVSSSDLANPVSFIDNALGVFTAMSAAKVGFTVYESEE